MVVAESSAGHLDWFKRHLVLAGELQCWQSLHQLAMLVDMPFHIQWEEMRCLEAILPGWARPWTAVTTDRR